ncbi:LPS export ABC transporter periplasmic protein LptC [Rhizobium sp. L1K21]|uniref:LPS export ABC transporter periplasmic protein LptC n=1 Tax=Rhizobium sp. L1K21 TaxID=2954933 RepID=UPI0020920088|nr:LPS export ABC transporter periplasmic protein LptC [Rhizobium sp. L1K21]MCO6187360.1 LPS export ABC transporter periplasmic protein LptC [Rhizobium sp. L1K21]
MSNIQSQELAVNGPAMSPRDYSAALKHSARVRRLKIILPAVTVVVAALFVSVSVVRSWLPENISIETATIEDGKIVMEKPALSGRNGDGIAYALKASRALQDIVSPNLITLESIAAQLPGSNGLMANIRAAVGNFDRDSEKLELPKPFDIDLSNGVNAHFRSASVDLTGGSMISDEKTTIIMSDASIVANKFEMKDNGQSLTFEGNVKVLVNPTSIRKEKE